MKRLGLAFAILFIAVIIGIQINQDPGYVLISANQWTVEMPLWLLVLILCCSFLILHLSIRIIRIFFHAPLSLREWRTKMQTRKAQQITIKGMIEFNEGYWNKAKNHLVAALPNSETPLLNYLTAAKAAQKMGDLTLRDSFLKEAQQVIPEAKIAVELTQAQLYLENNQYDQALGALIHLKNIVPHNPLVLKLLVDAYKLNSQWSELIALFSEIKKYKALSVFEFETLQFETFYAAFRELLKKDDLDACTRFYYSLPNKLQHHPSFIAEYTQLLISKKNYSMAKELLWRSLRTNIDDRLILLFSALPSNEKQLGYAENLLKRNPSSLPLYLCLGKICINQQLWGKAKTYLEHAAQFDPNPSVFASLGQLYEKLNSSEQAKKYYKMGLELAISKVDV